MNDHSTPQLSSIEENIGVVNELSSKITLEPMPEIVYQICKDIKAGRYNNLGTEDIVDSITDYILHIDPVDLKRHQGGE